MVIDALYAGQVLTATECAALAGITPSAMSYHLRALEKYGIVRRAEARGDARERPWVRAGETLTVSLKGARGSDSRLAATGLLVENSMRTDMARLLDAMRVESRVGDEYPWARTTSYVREQLLLTADEARALLEAIGELLAPYAWENRQSRPPGDAARFSSSVLLVREVEKD